MTSRHRSREVILQMLCQWDMSGESPRRVLALFAEHFGEGPLPDAFARQVFTAIADSRDDIDAVILQASEHWRIERMSCVDRNILRLATYEIVTPDSDTPAKVAINEAVELAKKFGAEDSPAFVNGILDRVAKDQRKLA